MEIFELRPLLEARSLSWKDKEGNHIEMGLHVFFGCYYNLFGIMERRVLRTAADEGAHPHLCE